MNSQTWMRTLGDSAWSHVAKDMDPEKVAQVLTRASEIGAIMPTRPPKVDPEGRTIMWPAGVPGLTAGGLLHFWKSRGHGWLLLNINVLCRAVAGPLLPRLQEILQAYHTQAVMEGEPPIAIDFHPFVGGEHTVYDPITMHQDITGVCEPPKASQTARARTVDNG